MRRYTWMAAASVALTTAALATAQQGGLPRFSGGFLPKQVVVKPFKPRNVVAPLNMPEPVNTGGLLRSFRLPSFPSVLGRSPLPPPTAFKSTYYPNTFKPREPKFQTINR